MSSNISKAGKDYYEKIVQALLDSISKIPESKEPKAENPGARGAELGRAAASKAAFVSGTLSLPPGPLGFLTILPDLMGVWKIQAQMVADIAGAFGKKALLTKEQMLYCLFRHAASQAMKDLVVRVGERILIKRATLKMIQNILQKVGVKVTQRVAGRAVSRWLPIIGAGLVAAYAFYDTLKVAETAIEFFGKDVQVEK